MILENGQLKTRQDQYVADSLNIVYLNQENVFTKKNTFSSIELNKTLGTSDSIVIRENNALKYRLDYLQRSNGLISPRTATDSIKIPQLASSVQALVEVKSNGLLDTVKTTDITTTLIHYPYKR